MFEASACTICVCMSNPKQLWPSILHLSTFECLSDETFGPLLQRTSHRKGIQNAVRRRLLGHREGLEGEDNECARSLLTSMDHQGGSQPRRSSAQRVRAPHRKGIQKSADEGCLGIENFWMERTMSGRGLGLHDFIVHEQS